MIRTGRLNSLSFGSIFVRDLIVGNKSSFRRKKADRALGVTSKLLIQQWQKFISEPRVPEKSPDLPPIYAAEDPMPKHLRHGPCDFSNYGVEKSQIASGGRSVGIVQ